MGTVEPLSLTWDPSNGFEVSFRKCYTCSFLWCWKAITPGHLAAASATMGAKCREHVRFASIDEVYSYESAHSFQSMTSDIAWRHGAEKMDGTQKNVPKVLSTSRHDLNAKATDIRLSLDV